MKMRLRIHVLVCMLLVGSTMSVEAGLLSGLRWIGGIIISPITYFISPSAQGAQSEPRDDQKQESEGEQESLKDDEGSKEGVQVTQSSSWWPSWSWFSWSFGEPELSDDQDVNVNAVDGSNGADAPQLEESESESEGHFHDDGQAGGIDGAPRASLGAGPQPVDPPLTTQEPLAQSSWIDSLRGIWKERDDFLRRLSQSSHEQYTQERAESTAKCLGLKVDDQLRVDIAKVLLLKENPELAKKCEGIIAEINKAFMITGQSSVEMVNAKKQAFEDLGKKYGEFRVRAAYAICSKQVNGSMPPNPHNDILVAIKKGAQHYDGTRAQGVSADEHGAGIADLGDPDSDLHDQDSLRDDLGSQGVVVQGALGAGQNQGVVHGGPDQQALRCSQCKAIDACACASSSSEVRIDKGEQQTKKTFTDAQTKYKTRLNDSNINNLELFKLGIQYYREAIGSHDYSNWYKEAYGLLGSKASSPEEVAFRAFLTCKSSDRFTGLWTMFVCYCCDDVSAKDENNYQKKLKQFNEICDQYDIEIDESDRELYSDFLRKTFFGKDDIAIGNDSGSCPVSSSSYATVSGSQNSTSQVKSDASDKRLPVKESEEGLVLLKQNKQHFIEDIKRNEWTDLVFVMQQAGEDSLLNDHDEAFKKAIKDTIATNQAKLKAQELVGDVLRSAVAHDQQQRAGVSAVCNASVHIDTALNHDPVHATGCNTMADVGPVCKAIDESGKSLEPVHQGQLDRSQWLVQLQQSPQLVHAINGFLHDNGYRNSNDNEDQRLDVQKMSDEQVISLLKDVCARYPHFLSLINQHKNAIDGAAQHALSSMLSDQDVGGGHATPLRAITHENENKKVNRPMNISLHGSGDAIATEAQQASLSVKRATLVDNSLPAIHECKRDDDGYDRKSVLEVDITDEKYELDVMEKFFDRQDENRKKELADLGKIIHTEKGSRRLTPLLPQIGSRECLEDRKWYVSKPFENMGEGNIDFGDENPQILDEFLSAHKSNERRSFFFGNKDRYKKPHYIMLESHGTFARNGRSWYDPKTPTFKAIMDFAATFPGDVEIIPLIWSGANTDEGRGELANLIEFTVDKIQKSLPECMIVFVGHSHGVNGFNKASHRFNKPIHMAVSLCAPVREEPDYRPNPRGVEWSLNFGSLGDPVMVFGSANPAQLAVNLLKYVVDKDAVGARKQHLEGFRGRGVNGNFHYVIREAGENGQMVHRSVMPTHSDVYALLRFGAPSVIQALKDGAFVRNNDLDVCIILQSGQTPITYVAPRHFVPNEKDKEYDPICRDERIRGERMRALFEHETGMPLNGIKPSVLAQLSAEARWHRDKQSPTGCDLNPLESMTISGSMLAPPYTADKKEVLAETSEAKSLVVDLGQINDWYDLGIDDESMKTVYQSLLDLDSKIRESVDADSVSQIKRETLSFNGGTIDLLGSYCGDLSATPEINPSTLRLQSGGSKMESISSELQ